MTIKRSELATSEVCFSREHCATCRARESGRGWRASLATSYRTPGDRIDFACPHGISWGEEREPSQLASPCHWLKAAIKQVTGASPCGACIERCKQMDAWGWVGCWRNRRVIAGWLTEEAEKLAAKQRQQGQELIERSKATAAAAEVLDERSALSALRAALIAMRR